MNIKIYQINMDRDDDGVAFMSLDSIARFQHFDEVNSAIYDKVFDGDVNCDSLEDVFRMFNSRHPDGYCGRSLSVSDIVEVTDPPKIVGEIKTSRTSHTYTDSLDYIGQQELLREQGVYFTAHDYTGMEKKLFEPGCYFCDSIGFQRVDFQPELTEDRSAERSMRVVLVEPGKVARPALIRGSLEGMQSVVKGTIEAFYPFSEEVAIICNDEGKLEGLPLNRAIRSDEPNGEIIDIVAGTFFICDCKGENFASLSDEQLQRYTEKYKNPEHFFRSAKGIVAVPYTPKEKEHGDAR